jgi:hypothetical protein
MTPELFALLVADARDRECRGHIRAVELLLAYGHGRPVQTTNVRKITSIQDLSDEELQALMAEAEPQG